MPSSGLCFSDTAEIQLKSFESEHVITARDSEIIESMGDGTMSVVASARQAMRAALALHDKTNSLDMEPWLAIGIGQHPCTGWKVLRYDNTVARTRRGHPSLASGHHRTRRLRD